ncbi:MAG: serine/threonine-protein kinase [Polyangiaceae bacterium]
MFSAGTIVGGDFRIVRPLAEGGMGAVFVAEQLSTSRLRALKVMRREVVLDPDARRRFTLEATVSGRILSEHVIDVIGAGVDEATGVPWLAMELLEGEDLRRRLDRGPLTHAEVAELFVQLRDALGKAADVGVVHRDLKPENIFLTPRVDGHWHVKVLDFGIARAMFAAQPATMASVGTPIYMAPEQTEPGAVISSAADVWPLGLIAFECLTGAVFWRTLRERETSAMMLAMEAFVHPMPAATQRAQELQVAPLPVGFDAWFASVVERDPAKRLTDARAAIDAFLPLVGGVSRVSSEVPITSQFPSNRNDSLRGLGFAETVAVKPAPRGRTRTPAVALALLGVAAGGLTLWFAFGRTSAPHPRSNAAENTASASVAPSSASVASSASVSAPVPSVPVPSVAASSAIPSVTPSASVPNPPAPPEPAAARRPCAELRRGGLQGASKFSLTYVDAPASCIAPPGLVPPGCPTGRAPIDWIAMERELFIYAGDDHHLVEIKKVFGDLVTERTTVQYATDGTPEVATVFGQGDMRISETHYTKEPDGSLFGDVKSGLGVFQRREHFVFDSAGRLDVVEIDHSGDGSRLEVQKYSYDADRPTGFDDVVWNGKTSTTVWSYDCAGDDGAPGF